MFGFHPANLAFRALLEIVALVAMAIGVYAVTPGGISSWLAAVALPLVAMVAWSTFNVPGDRSRSGKAPVPVPGIVRLLIEFDVFAVAILLLWFTWPEAAVVLGILVVVHYALSWDRVMWLVRSSNAPAP